MKSDTINPGQQPTQFARTLSGLLMLIGCAINTNAQQTPVSFNTAVDLALRNSNSVSVAQATVQKAEGLLAQTHDVYIPSLVGGSNLGYSYGFPLGQPTIFNFSTQSLIYNFSQNDYIRSSRAGLQATQLGLKDARQQTIEDAALTYIELDTALQQQHALDDQNAAASRLEEIMVQRESAGMESHVEVLRSELIQAQIHLKQLHGHNNIAALRSHLAHITGLPADGLATDTASIPATPELPAALDTLPESPAVQSAYAQAHADQETAYGDARQLWRPEFGFSAQYSRFASFNNYAEYYKNFQSSNFGIGLQITLPVFDAVRRARAQQSAAEAVIAKRQADLLRDQAAEGNLKMINALQELSARETIAKLQSEISSEQLKSVLMQLQNSSSLSRNAQAPMLSPADEQSARIDERQKFVDLLDSQLELTHMQLDLLRASGSIENWAQSSTQSSIGPVSSSK